jgi:hypothetical protein
MSLTKSGVALKKLNIKGKYNEFSDFYDVNKVVIYKNILKLFTQFKNKEKDTLVLTISAKIKGLDWETDLKFTRDEINVLKRDIMPYFEQIEDYETCGEICKLHKTLKES